MECYDGMWTYKDKKTSTPPKFNLAPEKLPSQ